MAGSLDATITETDEWGIEAGYAGADGAWKEATPGTLEAIRAAMGSPGPKATPDPGGDADRVTCRFPEPPGRGWGIAVQLYALRSSESWGIGDLGDLLRLARWASRRGATFLQANPLMAAQPFPRAEASPYLPGSRLFLNPIYLRIESVPGAEEAIEELRDVAARGRELNRRGLLARDEAYALKLSALEIIWPRWRTRPDGSSAFERFVAEGGRCLARYARYCALAEEFGADWRAWPHEYRHPDGPSVAGYAATRADRIRFHQWTQWLLDTQLEAVAREIRLIQDLPVGFSPSGADAWSWQDLLALDAEIGAPPDAFNANGQGWGLPPFIPHRLAAAGFAPIIEALRRILRHAGGIRIDHAMGLFRLFWIPKGAGPGEGAYVRYPHAGILDAFARACATSGAFAIGEDLGTVAPGIRVAMVEWGILGTKALWFEKEPPAGFAPMTFATLGTHDLPTLMGLATGADAREQREAGLDPGEGEGNPGMDRIRAAAPPAPDRSALIEAAHGILAEAGSMLAAVSLDDALGAERRPNLPGTVSRPNWSIPLPKALEEILADPMLERIAGIMERAGRRRRESR